MKDKITLVVSKQMDTNKKESRNENSLIRIGRRARNSLGLDQETHVELWPEGSVDERINRSKNLKIYHAYKNEIKKLRNEGWSEEDLTKVAFVTSTTFSALCGGHKNHGQEDAWIADTVEETVIGADPEFVLLSDNDEIVHAGDLLSWAGELGCDGYMAEMRPRPAIEVDDFVDNIYKILTDHVDVHRIEPYRWIGCCVYSGPVMNSERDRPLDLSVGGHLHFGTPAKLVGVLQDFSNKSNNLRRHYEYFMYGTLNKILDELIAIPMVKVEGKEQAVTRRRIYGKYGGFRTEHGRLEYRTLGGEWLVHPELTRILVGSAKAIAHSYFQMLDESGYDQSLIVPARFKDQIYNDFIPNDLYNVEESNDIWNHVELARHFGATSTNNVMQDRLHNANITFNGQYLNRLRSRFRNLQTYNEYADYIDKFVELISLPAEELVNKDRELKHTWIGGAKFII